MPLSWQIRIRVWTQMWQYLLETLCTAIVFFLSLEHTHTAQKQWLTGLSHPLGGRQIIRYYIFNFA
jgi:hypothetical protein